MDKLLYFLPCLWMSFAHGYIPSLAWEPVKSKTTWYDVQVCVQQFVTWILTKCDLILFPNSMPLSNLYYLLWINNCFCTSLSSSSLVWFVNLLFFQSLFNLYLGSQNYTHTFIWHCYQYLSHLSCKHTGFHWSAAETIRLRPKNS